jgi:hydroxymethylglutaryl-CoA synthase
MNATKIFGREIKLGFKVGIVGYGTFLPRCRLSLREIIDVWHNRNQHDLQRAMVSEKAVPELDEDAITMAIDASREAIEVSSLAPMDIKAVYLGSCSHPYVAKASSAILLETLGIGHDALCADVQFSGKSGSAAIQICTSLVKARMVRYGLAAASDCLGFRSRPGEDFEYYASAGAAAYIIGAGKNILAEIEDTYSYNTDTNDYFRLDGDRYIRYGGGALDLGKMGYERHTKAATEGLMTRLGYGPQDFDFVVFHQPNGSRPYAMGSALGFKKEQIQTGNLAEILGDCGAASSLIGLAAVLDEAEPGARILLVSYGFGAGSDAFSFTVTDEVKSRRRKTVRDKIKQKKTISYATSVLFERKYVRTFQGE